MQQWLTNFAMKVQRFMMGRYGGDQLNMALLILSVVVSLVSGFVPMGWICTIVSTILIALVFFRMLSRNTSRRFKENYVFLKVWNPVKNWFQWLYLSVRYMKKNRYLLQNLVNNHFDQIFPLIFAHTFLQIFLHHICINSYQPLLLIYI